MEDNSPTPDRSQVDRLSQGQRAAAAAAQRELSRTFETILAMPGGPADQRNALLELVPAIARTFGNVDSKAAAEWYDEMRRKWFKEEDYTASVGYDVDEVPMRKTIRRLARHLWKGEDGSPPDTDALLRGLRANLDRWVMAGGRETIGRAVRDDPRGARYARVPQGPSCGFCIMLASRGYVYLSAENAGADTQWHNDCDCEIAVSWDGEEPKIEGYNHQDMYQRYLTCRKTIESRLTEDRYQTTYVDTFVPKNEKDEPIKFEDWVERQVAAEMDWRDHQWLFDGTEPEITFETEALEQQIRKEHAQELDTAERLRRLGIPPHFVVDTETYFDEEKGIEQTRGLADWENGIEIKTLLDTGSKNTINAHLKDTSRKRNATRVIFDNTDNKALTDDELKEILSSSRRFKQGMIYMLSKDQLLIRIR
ncbi:hypothetical protein JS531_04295 [Bifidobacterium sp. CP2]|uniref:VG15 protein n=1 Tax=Bifidobacterium sp. CP2 TaxID=2809025 RepID=UPI001BDDBF83|nr:hypothetical protein [Bifidobacterium sp. CP2]MBT1181205.1 hypothetical protein [Bifidobacterium sp. CP2]